MSVGKKKRKGKGRFVWRGPKDHIGRGEDRGEGRSEGQTTKYTKAIETVFALAWKQGEETKG